jgi:hypothetical protein
MSRAPTDLEPREQARFSRSQRDAILLRQSVEGADNIHRAMCDECGAHIATLNADGRWTPERWHDFDHSQPRGLYGKTSIANGRAICRDTCHREKTDTDVAMIAKADRMSGTRSGQYARRQKRRALGKAALIRGKGFPKHG